MSGVASSSDSPKWSTAAINPSTQNPLQRFRTAAVRVHAVVHMTRMERFKRNAKYASKKLLVFTLSKVGIICVCVAYAIGGAFLFQHLENGAPSPPSPVATVSDVETVETIKDTENNFTLAAIELENIRSKYVKNLTAETLQMNIFYPDKLEAFFTDQVMTYELEILEFLKEWSWDGLSTNAPPTPEPPVEEAEEEEQDEVESWSYATALLFTIATMTSIGYGDTVVITDKGKVAVILYAVIGIPMTLLCLSNIGKFMATSYRFLWKHTNHLRLVLLRSPNRHEALVKTDMVRVPLSVSLLTMFFYLLLGATIFSNWEGWTFLDGCYFSFVTLSTVGFGDFVPGKGTITVASNAKRVVCALYLLFGLSLVAMVFQLIQDSVTVITERFAQLFGLSKEQINGGRRLDDLQSSSLENGKCSESSGNQWHTLLSDAKKLNTSTGNEHINVDISEEKAFNKLNQKMGTDYTKTLEESKGNTQKLDKQAKKEAKRLKKQVKRDEKNLNKQTKQKTKTLNTEGDNIKEV